MYKCKLYCENLKENRGWSKKQMTTFCSESYHLPLNLVLHFLNSGEAVGQHRFQFAPVAEASCFHSRRREVFTYNKWWTPIEQQSPNWSSWAEKAIAFEVEGSLSWWGYTRMISLAKTWPSDVIPIRLTSFAQGDCSWEDRELVIIFVAEATSFH